MSDTSDRSEPSTVTDKRSVLSYQEWQKSSRNLDYEQWRKNQLGVGFEQWILDQPGVEYEQWVKTVLGGDYDRLISNPSSVKPPPRTLFESWTVGILPLGISSIIGMCLIFVAVPLGVNSLATIGTVVGLVFWPVILTRERDIEYQIAALESRPEDMNCDVRRSLILGVRRRMKVSKYRGYEHLVSLLVMVPLTLVFWTVFAIELLDKI